MGLPSTSSSLACHEDSYPCGLLMGQAKVTIPVILSLLCASPGVPRHSATNWVTIKTMQMYPLTVLEAGRLKASVSVSSPLHISHWYRAHLKFTMVTSQDSELITAAKTYFQRRSHSEIPNGYEFRGHYPTPYTTLSTIP